MDSEVMLGFIACALGVALGGCAVVVSRAFRTHGLFLLNVAMSAALAVHVLWSRVPDLLSHGGTGIAAVVVLFVVVAVAFAVRLKRGPVLDPRERYVSHLVALGLATLLAAQVARDIANVGIEPLFDEGAVMTLFWIPFAASGALVGSDAANAITRLRFRRIEQSMQPRDRSHGHPFGKQPQSGRMEA